MSELILIRAYRSRLDAEQAMQYLEGQGIDAMVQADDAGGMAAGLSFGKKGVRLLVRADDADRARDALEPGEVVDSMAAADQGAGTDHVPAPLVAAEAAVRNFDRGYNCAEAVFLAFAEDVGEPDLVRIASGFGGGMGRDGDVCGAVSGAVMALGLWGGRVAPEDEAARDRCYASVRELREQFRAAFGSLDCRDLTGADLTREEERARVEREGIRASVCRRCVHEAASITARLLAGA